MKDSLPLRCPLDAAAFRGCTLEKEHGYALDEVPEDVILRCVDAAQVAPNSSNLQCWELHRVSDVTRKEQLVKACLSQPAAATAPELFVFVARPDLETQQPVDASGV